MQRFSVTPSSISMRVLYKVKTKVSTKFINSVTLIFEITSPIQRLERRKVHLQGELPIQHFRLFLNISKQQADDNI